jgi:hypothetical protein
MAKQYSAAVIAAALTESKGMVYVAAQKVGCCAQTIYNYIRDYKVVAQAAQHQNGLLGDMSELKLFTAIQNNEPWAIAFYLKTKGKDRGYTERTEVSGPGGGPERIIVEYVNTPPEDTEPAHGTDES